jgi:hypothetical protein
MLKNMTQIEFARWFTDEDHEKLKSLISFNKDQNNPESQLTWLQKHSDKIIKLHEEYKLDEHNKQEAKYKEHLEVIKQNNDFVDGIKNGAVEYCICGSELKFVSNFNFVGCSNWQDKTKEHKSYNYKKNYYKDDPFFTYYSLDYLSDICKIIKSKYNIKIQAGNLYEFYTLNKVTLLRHEITKEKFSKLKQNSEISKKREILIKSILEQNNLRFGYQKKIMYKLKDKKQTHAIPDFIVLFDNSLCIIEQKKNLESCNDYQLIFYKELLQFMYPNKRINCIFVIEEDVESDDNDNLGHPVFTINELKDWLSCI